jgi:hypothetical protein
MEPTTEWLTYQEASQRLNVSPEAIRARAIRGHWRRQVGNDGLARIVMPTEILRTSGQPQINGRSTAALIATGRPQVNGQSPAERPITLLATMSTMTALRDHVATLKADNERLAGDLAGLRSDLIAERQRADGAMTNIERLTIELAGERAARQADQEQLTAERAGRQADQERAAARQADQEQQLAAARAAADRGTAELVELAKRLAEIAEKQASAEPEPLRRSAAGRAWRWFLRN